MNRNYDLGMTKLYADDIAKLDVICLDCCNAGHGLAIRLGFSVCAKLATSVATVTVSR